MSFALGERSRSRLAHVHPALVSVVEAAIQVTTVDFAVLEGARTIERQRELVAAGSSWTMNSRHIPTRDATLPGGPMVAHAVDLGASIGGVISWDMRHYAAIAVAMAYAAKVKRIPIVWGAVWDRTLGQLNPAGDGFNDDINEYVARFKAARNKRPHLDGPHFELSRQAYP